MHRRLLTLRNFSPILSKSASALAVLLGLLVMIGWWANNPHLKSVIAGLPVMKFNTALCFVLIGIALSLDDLPSASRYHLFGIRAGQVAAIAVIAVSGLTLVEDLFRTNLGIDQFFVTDDSGDVHPGRMVLVTALAFLLLGISIALLEALRSAGLRASQFAAIAANLVGFWGVLDIVLDPFRSNTGIAAHTAFGLWLFSFGVLASCSGKGVLRMLSSDMAGGHAARRLLPAAVGIPLVVGVLRWNSATLLGAEVRTSILVLVSTILLVLTTLWTASGLDRLDRARRITEARFRGLLESAPDPIIVVDARGRIVVANQQTENVFGYQREELLSQPIGILLPDRFRDVHAADVRNFFLAPAARSMGQAGELLARRKDGSEFPAEISLGPFGGDEGILVSCAVRNITDRLGLQQSLRANERRLSLALAAGHMGVWDLDMRSGECWRTLEHDHLFGYDELLPRWEFSRFQAHVHPDDRAATEQAFSDSYRTGQLKIECRIVRTDQAVRWVRIDGEIVRDERQTPLHMQGVIHDITERKSAEEELLAAEERYRLLVDGVKDYGIFMLDREGRVATWNEGARRQKGYSSAEVLGSDASMFYPKEERAARKDLNLLETALREGSVTDEGWRERKDGSRIWAEVVITALRDRRGDLLGFSNCSRDLTERKKAEEDLRRSNAELQQFAYVASHDLQEPLRMVASFTQLLAKRYEGKLGKDADEFIGYAVDGARRMQLLIEDLLAYSRVGTRARELMLCSAGDVVGAALRHLTIAIEENGAVIHTSDLPGIVCDDLQMTSVFQNLVGNAIKFRIPNVPPVIEIAAARSGAEWVFSVKDNGIGIEPRHFERVFQVFQRLQTREDYPGNGIGLAICRKIVERHGGRIWLESEPGKGTTFLFTIPCPTDSQFEEKANDVAYTSALS